ncbi:hypothetical protein FisN_4Hh006 [Fistulifera solaris]|uniref:Histidine kinase/HSP90-like ATPase domain-containing protein n=1 Tax=Fistulifera solaris TaxID=1519565 RepID=A0A1Z5KPV5_FISSO|nr:hypothetical protein FisN_4Hh006 [Fistulifera solaris]|eukprot:GAX28344.1 hypothetical protein FisN_4Hh006 [Fistulifera solaris]
MRFSKVVVQALALLLVHSNFPFPAFRSTGITLAQAQEAGIVEKGEVYKFEAEVHRMLDIVVNSLYQNNDVFLRELISNGSDAIDKFRYMSLTEPEKYKVEGEDEVPLEVKIEYDAEEQTLTVRDTGIGMTHDELVSNLGTVARSGTTKFMNALKESGNADSTMSQIGQFGVGFYSAFLVADKVTVASKSPLDSVQYVWESENGSASFNVYPDPRGNTLLRGTEITLHLKENALEYADPDRLRELAKHYSEFVVYPISLRTTKTIRVLDEEEEDPTKAETEDDKKDDEEIAVEEEEESPKEKKFKDLKTHQYEVLNGNPALWTRDKEDISEEEYKSFWHTLAGEQAEEYVGHSHFTAEGNINFKSLLYLPNEVPAHYRLGSIDNVEKGMRLFVRRVLISDSFELLPRYLGFIRGVVDSDDLPLNVNRETLQESKILQVIKKKVVRKAIDMIKHFADENDEIKDELDDEGNPIEPDDQAVSKYITWYKKFSPNIKLGVIEDEPNRAKLSKLLRFQTSKSEGKFISLDKYVENMKDWQKNIYVLGGTSAEEIAKSPFLETAKEKDVEVLFLTDAIDEYLVKQIVDYKNNKFMHLSSEGVKFQDESADLVARREKYYRKKFKPLIEWLRKLYQGSVLRVQVAKRSLGQIPAVVSSSDFGNSANMERILRAQAFQHGVDERGYMAMKVFEINPRHPLIVKLFEGVGSGDDDVSQDLIDAALMIHDMAMLNGGFPIGDPVAHNNRLLKVLQGSFGLDSLALEPELDPAEFEEDEEESPKTTAGGLNAEDFEELNINDLIIDADKDEL